MIAIKGMEMPKNCVECNNIGLQQIIGCELICSGCANCGRHPNCLLVEIVTCKDCKHWDKSWKTSNGGHYCGMIDSCISDGNFYCANAERRE